MDTSDNDEAIEARAKISNETNCKSTLIMIINVYVLLYLYIYRF